MGAHRHYSRIICPSGGCITRKRHAAKKGWRTSVSRLMAVACIYWLLVLYF